MSAATEAPGAPTHADVVDEDRLWRKLARVAPLAIVAYCLALAALRLALSPYLEVDEAEFVGRVDLRLVYDNSHPPLFNWLARIALETTGWRWAGALAIVKYGLLAAFHWFVFDAARRLAGPRAGVLALAASAMLPQIVWMSAVTLAHSIAVVACAAGVVWAATRAREAKSWGPHLALGALAAAGALAKFNFLLFLAPFLVAVALDPRWRPVVSGARAAAAAAVFALLAGPSYVAALLHLGDSASRIGRLYRPDGALAWIDVPYLGVDGLLSLVIAALAWAGLAVVVWGVAVWAERRAARRDRLGGDAVEQDEGAEAADALGRAMVFALGAFAVIVLLSDMHKIEERYLTPLLAPLPVYLAARRPLRRAAPVVLGVAAAAYLAVFPGFAGMANFGAHRFGYPYDAVAAQIRTAAQAAGWDEARILSRRHDDAANLTLALGWEGSRTPAYAMIDERALLVWRGRGAAPPNLAPEGFIAIGAPQRVAEGFINFRAGGVAYSFQLFERADRSRE